jgi:hypothetical protein
VLVHGFSEGAQCWTGEGKRKTKALCCEPAQFIKPEHARKSGGSLVNRDAPLALWVVIRYFKTAFMVNAFGFESENLPTTT